MSTCSRRCSYSGRCCDRMPSGAKTSPISSMADGLTIVPDCVAWTRSRSESALRSTPGGASNDLRRSAGRLCSMREASAATVQSVPSPSRSNCLRIAGSSSSSWPTSSEKISRVTRASENARCGLSCLNLKRELRPPSE